MTKAKIIFLLAGMTSASCEFKFFDLHNKPVNDSRISNLVKMHEGALSNLRPGSHFRALTNDDHNRVYILDCIKGNKNTVTVETSAKIFDGNEDSKIEIKHEGGLYLFDDHNKNEHCIINMRDEKITLVQVLRNLILCKKGNKLTLYLSFATETKDLPFNLIKPL
jgi:hypothetical protein